MNGQRITANLDTGSNGSFQLTPAAVAKRGLEAHVAQAEVSRSVGFNGATENRRGTVGNITVGAFSIEAPQVVFYGRATGRDDERWGVRIGNTLLQDFVVTIDDRAKRVTLEKSRAE